MERSLFKSDFSEFYFSFPNTIVMSRFSLPAVPICTSVLFQLNLNLNEFELHSVKFKFNVLELNLGISTQFKNLNSLQFRNFNSLQIQFISSCKQCHSICSLKWNLVFTKSIQFFISWLSFVLHHLTMQMWLEIDWTGIGW